MTNRPTQKYIKIKNSTNHLESIIPENNKFLLMLYTFVRESFGGRCVYHLSHRKLFNYKEEQRDYVIPEKYLGKSESDVSSENKREPKVESEEQPKIEKSPNNLEVPHGQSDPISRSASTSSNISNSSNSSNTNSTCVSDNYIIVDWEGEDDPENPVNWPLPYKILFLFEIGMLTALVYMASAIYTPGIPDLMEKFDCDETMAILPLTLFVFGYGIGPMVFSPMSENARFGRTSIYIVTLFIFFILQIPTALADDIASLCVLRFIAGFFASPCLATGGASAVDISHPAYIPIFISFWSASACCAPSMGPMFGAIVTVKGDFHWTFWFVCIALGASFLVLGCFLPESYGKTILYRKAERLRALTGNDKIVSEGHLENMKMTTREIAIDILWRPFEIILFEPVVLLINVYIGLIYSILYLWFEAFPIVFVETHHFSLIPLGVSYSTILVGIIIAEIFYVAYIVKFYTRKIQTNQEVVPEMFLPIAIVGGSLMPVGIFIFGWTSASDLNWMGPLVGAAIFAAGCFLVFQTSFNYLSMSFYRFLASVFAGNDLFRSLMAGAFPLFGRALFLNLSTKRFVVGWGSTVLGFLTMLMILIPVVFYMNGPKLRARSKYSGN